MDDALDDGFFIGRQDDVPQFLFYDFHTAPFDISRQDVFYFHRIRSFLNWRQAPIKRDAQSGQPLK